MRARGGPYALLAPEARGSCAPEVRKSCDVAALRAELDLDLRECSDPPAMSSGALEVGPPVRRHEEQVLST